MQVELEIPIAAGPQRVWRALVDETAAWWNAEFYTAPPTRPNPRMVIEARPGGRVYEDWGEGAGALWYTVVSVDPPASLLLLGHLPPGFGGPAMTMLRLTLEPGGGDRASSTVLRVSDTVFGGRGEGVGASTREGWALLFDGLRRYVEGEAGR